MPFLRIIECDACGKQIHFYSKQSKKSMSMISRDRYEWSVGKYILCKECKKDKSAKRIVKENLEI